MPLTPSNLNTSVSTLAQPPHFSSLIGKTLSLDKQHNVVVEEVLAEGGFGVIFLVKNSDKVKYAMKRVVVNSERDYEGVVGEVGVMSTLSQKIPHILQSITHMIVSYPNKMFELCNLMPLCKHNLLQVASSKMSKNITFTNEEILNIIQAVASGLQYLHNSTPPIIHRDVKIENILVQDENYVLSDFGSATTKIWDPDVDSVVVINEDLDRNTTLLYRSPEMVDLYGGRGAIGCSSDVWALGVAAFKLMSYKDPFETILAIQNRNLSWGGTKNKFSEFVVSTVDVCLAEDQNVRPAVSQLVSIVTNGLNSDWSGLHDVAAKISESLKVKKEEEVRCKVVNPVVMETTVTPRQRPKRGDRGVNLDAAIVIAGPPKSPKPVSPHNNSVMGPPAPNTTSCSTTPSQSTTPLPQQRVSSSPTAATIPVVSSSSATPSPQPTTHSWNPFDEDYSPTVHYNCDNNSEDIPKQDGGQDEDDDPFAKAPFDYFKYQPIVAASGHLPVQQNSSPCQYYAPNNPFLNYYEDDAVVRSVTEQHSIGGSSSAGVIGSGVCNLSFDDNNVGSNNDSGSSGSDSQVDFVNNVNVGNKEFVE